MKALQISAQSGATLARPLAFPAVYRKGDAPAEWFRRQASGQIPKAEQNLSAAAFVRTIVVRDGRFTSLASAPGALLTFVVSGELSFATGAGEATRLVPGDIFLVDADSASRVVPTARGDCRLIQLGVAADWPGPDAKLQDPGTLTPRRGEKPNIKRLYNGKDDRTYFSEFTELFPAPANEWSAPRATTGFRFMCWEDGFIDWHPEVINNLAIFLSGELELESGGAGGAIEVFHAGDVCLAEDRTGEGHIDRTRGVTHVALIVVETENLW
jgi:quercetin dioxygenase-like cupin family protein